MRNETRIQFDQYTSQVAKLSGVNSALVSFSVDPTTQQKLEARMQESSDFLGKINMIGVDELTGEKVGVGVSSTIAGRTDTSGAGERVPQDVTALDSNTYTCAKTDFDTAIPYARLDAWAKFPDFQTKLRDAIIQRQALDRIMIGFNGTSVAATTNRATNPLLQDVNKGWLQQYRANAPQRVLDEGTTAGKVRVGAGGDYANLDALVYDAVNNLIDPWHQEDTGLVVILSRSLLHDKYFPLLNQDQPATEKIASDLIVSQKRVGGLQAVRVPFVPAGALMITSLANLSLYYQLGGRRRYIQEKPSKNRIENFESSNDAYVVEDYGLGCVVENIELV